MVDDVHQGKRDTAYQRHVLMGFTRPQNPKYDFDVDLVLATYAHKIVEGDSVRPDAFERWVDSAVAKA